MVEKTKPAADIEKRDGLARRPGILKKKSNLSLETVPEFAQSPLERTESNLAVVESEKSATSNEEQNKFKTLCEGVQNCLALFQTSLTELLCLKDELLKHTLPPSLLLKTVLVTGKLFRSSSDLSVPITELVRMVKLYSMQWETKGAALKKLHEDYENKQRQLNVALQKLVLVGIQSERLAQERKVLNWEKLFSKMMTSKAQGYRWKFLIESFKEKVNTGEVHVAESSTDEEAERERKKSERQLDFLQRRSMNRDTAAKRIIRESVSGSNSPLVTVEKEKQDGDEDEFITDEKSTSVVKRNVSPERQSLSPTRTILSPESTSGLRPNPPREEKPQPRKMTRPRIKFFGASDSEDTEDEKLTTAKFTEKPLKPKRKAMFADNVEEKQPKVTPINSEIMVSSVKFVMSDQEEENLELGEKNQAKVAALTTPPVVKVDKECWTHEPEFDRFLHLRIFRPECKKVDDPLCSVAFNGQLLKTDVFEDVQKELGEESTDELVAQGLSAKSGSKKTEQSGSDDRKTGSTPKTSQTGLVGKKNSKTKLPRGASSRASNTSPSSRPASGDVAKESSPRRSFKELVFRLPDSNGRVFGESPKDVTKDTIRIAVHPGRDRPIMAMSSISYGDLKIMDHFEGRWSHTEDTDTSQQQFPLTSVVSDRDMPFNSLCGHVSVVCYLSHVERPRTFVKSTETVSFDELIDAEIETRRRAEREDEQEKIPEPVYTEGDIKALRDQHAEELQLLQEEYEKRLNELARGLGPYPPGAEFPQEYTDVATLPMFIQSPLAVRSPSPDQNKTPRPPPGTRSNSPRKPRPKIPNLPDWGKDLPQDFLVRLHLFAENSIKYRQELSEKTRRAIQEKYELQMAVQNRLAEPEEERTEETDVCLPAVFMPTRPGHVFSPKAHSYFHPPGAAEGRLTQAPSIFKLPAVTTESQISVLNLFEVGQKYNSTGAPWVHQEQTRPQTIANPELSQFAPPPPTACDMWSPPPYQERARTR